MSVHVQRALAAVGIAVGFAASALFGSVIGRADVPVWTVDGQDYSQCYLEDGSDAYPNLPCVWIDPDTGDHYLTFEHYSVRITH